MTIDSTAMDVRQGLTDDDYTRSSPHRSNTEIAWTVYPSFPDWFYETISSLSKLALLGPDWDSYGGVPIDHNCIEIALLFLHTISQASPPQPHIGPVPDGGVQIEWHTKGIDLEIEINPEHGISFFYKDDSKTVEREMDYGAALYATLDAIKKLK